MISVIYLYYVIDIYLTIINLIILLKYPIQSQLYTYVVIYNFNI